MHGKARRWGREEMIIDIEKGWRGANGSMENMGEWLIRCEALRGVYLLQGHVSRVTLSSEQALTPLQLARVGLHYSCRKPHTGPQGETGWPRARLEMHYSCRLPHRHTQTYRGTLDLCRQDLSCVTHTGFHAHMDRRRQNEACIIHTGWRAHWHRAA